MQHFMKTPWRRTSALARSLALVALAAASWALSVQASLAQARDVHWSITIQQPGLALGASTAHPVLVPVPVHVPVHRGSLRPRWEDRWEDRWEERRERRHHWRKHHDHHDHHDHGRRDEHHDRYGWNGRGNDPRHPNRY